MADAFIKQLAQNGLPSLLLAIALVAIWFLYRENKELHSEKDRLYEKFNELLKETITANQQLSVSIQLLTEKITKGRR